MKFHVTEIKSLGHGMSRRLSLRLEKSDDPNQAQSTGMGEPPAAVFTIHAVVPYSPEFGPTQIGQEFELKEATKIRPSIVCEDPNCSRYFSNGHPHLISKECELVRRESKP